jgi:hypothetical protein
VHWTLDRVPGRKHTYTLENLGARTARGVTITSDNAVRLDGDIGPQDIEARGGQMTFLAIGSWQNGIPEIVVRWNDDQGEHQWRRIVA